MEKENIARKMLEAFVVMAQLVGKVEHFLGTSLDGCPIVATFEDKLLNPALALMGITDPYDLPDHLYFNLYTPSAGAADIDAIIDFCRRHTEVTDDA